MLQAPFLPMGKSAILTADVASATCPVSFANVAAGLNLGGAIPNQIRLLNIGTAMIWLSFGAFTAAVPAVIPVAGTTTLGTAAAVAWLAPGVEITLSLPVSIGPLVGVAGNPTGFFLSHISGSAAQNFQLQLGEGT